MTIDINLLRPAAGGQPDVVKKSEEKRGNNPEGVDKVIKLDEDWKKVRFDLDELNKQANALQKEIATLKKAKQDASAIIANRVQVIKQREVLEKQEQDRIKERQAAMREIGNIVHPKVVVSMDEAQNEVLREWKPAKDPMDGRRGDKIRSHHEVLTCIGGYDQERGVKTAGHRGYFLTDFGVELAFALIQYGLSFLKKRKFRKIMPPYMISKEHMAKTAQLSEFDEALYKVSGDGKDDKATDDRYLIATSEQPLSIYHMDEWLEPAALPIRYAGYSTCFRKEAGAHGKETWGIFRVHQFEKVEQFCFTDPEKSWEMFDEMIQTSEEFYQSLGIPYRIVSIVSGALNNAAAMKCDLEAWFPFQKEYKELVSCSNCTDYQARELEVRCGTKKMGDREKKYVHMLNATLVAVERAMCAVVENYQGQKIEGTGDDAVTTQGVWVPEVLHKYFDDEFLPFVKQPKESDREAARKKK